ncbi:hypothetical protein MRX96_025392 [Rhipicephalus microplus]
MNDATLSRTVLTGQDLEEERAGDSEGSAQSRERLWERKDRTTVVCARLGFGCSQLDATRPSGRLDRRSSSLTPRPGETLTVPDSRWSSPSTVLLTLESELCRIATAPDLWVSSPFSIFTWCALLRGKGTLALPLSWRENKSNFGCNRLDVNVMLPTCFYT